MEEAAKQHLPWIKEVAEASPKRAQQLLKHAPLPFVRFIGDVAYNLLKNRIPLSKDNYDYFRRRRSKLEKAGWSPKYRAVERRQFLRHRGGNLSRDLSRLVLKALQCPDKDHMQEAKEKP